MVKKSAAGLKDGCLMPFHAIFEQNLVGGLVTTVVSPAGLSNRAATEADAWTHFRVVRLKFRLLPPASSTLASYQNASFLPGVQDTPPASRTQASELIASSTLGARQTVPSQWVNVTRSELAGALPWYKSVAGAADPTEESPGIFCLCGSGTDPIIAELFGMFEFKGAVATANTPAAIALRNELRAYRLSKANEDEKARMLAVLGTMPTQLGGVTSRRV
jgi:hypothetical protein